jgi:hypothetical protein
MSMSGEVTLAVCNFLTSPVGIVLVLLLYGIIIAIRTGQINQMPEDTPEQREAKAMAWDDLQDMD